MESVQVKVKYYESYDLKEWGPVTYSKEGDACFDIRTVENGIIYPKHSAIFKCGISIEIPSNYELQIRGRSGLAFKDDLIYHFGTIDSGYRGEIALKIFNFNENKIFHVSRGMRLAQAKLAIVPNVELISVTELSDSERGENGFGSTGLNEITEKKTCIFSKCKC